LRVPVHDEDLVDITTEVRLEARRAVACRRTLEAIIAPNQGLVIKMFKDGDPQGLNALPARETLGPDWQEQIKKDSVTRF
jgi:hypothetical protein